MATVFISYSRKDIEFAKRLVGRLQENSMDVWVDWEGIPPTVDWWKEIEKGIEEADAFVFLISPDSVTSKVCEQELDFAVKNAKRIVPLVLRDIKASDAPTALASLNWIFFREQDDFDKSYKKLHTAIHTDYDWVQTHRRLQVKALEWEKMNKDGSFLLRGKDLADAEFQFAANGSKEPHPSDLQREYVFKSRQATDRLERLVTAVAVVVAILLAGLAVFGFYQAGLARAAQAVAETNEDKAVKAQARAEEQQMIAEEQTRKALAGSLAAQADSLKSTDHALALLLGIEAYHNENNLLTRTTLFRLLEFSPHTTLFGYTGPVTSVAVSPDGKILASANCREFTNNLCKYGEIVLTDALTKQPIKKIEGKYGLVSSLSFHQSQNQVLLAAAGCVPVDGAFRGCIDNKGQITLWDVATAAEPKLLASITDGHNNLVKTVTFNHAGNLLASGSFDTNIIVWNIADPASPVMFMNPLGHKSFVNSLAFSADDKTLVSGGDDHNILVWDVSDKNAVKPLDSPLEPHKAAVNRVAFSPDGKQLVSASNDGTLMLWSWNAAARTLENPRILEGHEGYVKDAAFSADGKMLASVGFDSAVILWDTATAERIGLPLIGHVKVINVAAFGADATKAYLFTGSDDRTIIQWDLSTRVPSSKPIDAGAPILSPTATSGDREAYVINEQQIALSGRVNPLAEHTGGINSLVFSQPIDDNTLLASASDDKTVILWDVTDVAKVGVFLKLTEFNNPVLAVYFDGAKLVSTESNGFQVQWTVSPTDWVTLACTAAQRNLTDVEWSNYLPGQAYRKICPANP